MSTTTKAEMLQRTDARRAETPVLEARNVFLDFNGQDHNGKSRTIRAVDGVDLTLHEGEIVALVGESGSGKSTLARLFALIYKPTSGELLYRGKRIDAANRREQREYYERVQMIYQDPFNSLNSLKKISHTIGRVLRIHKIANTTSKVRERTAELLEGVGLSPASRYMDRFPSELSGGQRQRVAIARCLAVAPNVILADEPTSMLDASIRLEVLNLLADLREREGLAVLFITHDIASARYLSDRVNVMYGGRVVESGPTEAVVSQPLHPYTQLLMQSAPDPARYKGSGNRAQVPVTASHPVDNSQEVIGCRFAARCPSAMSKCVDLPLPTFEVGQRTVRCWLAESLAQENPGNDLPGDNRSTTQPVKEAS